MSEITDFVYWRDMCLAAEGECNALKASNANLRAHISRLIEAGNRLYAFAHFEPPGGTREESMDAWRKAKDDYHHWVREWCGRAK